ncbi:DeoR C terminal sensor domain-containing protein [Alicyclobacillus vulcanalis]|uniref:DeoR C terminal sensor domain-containing protein n=2 Tax=Alicyclobacillus vulcanalis TaxID=252246 RepID=A0A1N7LLQ2_9BACL|nr:DeoR C terminal sensor domain-containing protein [Alicyclobacillus vulcanalis]
MIGGLVKPEIYSTDGELAIQMLSSLFVDIAFIGCDSFTSEVAMSRSVHKAALKRAMMKAAHRKILLADSSKFGQHSFQRIAELQEFDAVVTDAAFPEDAREVLADLGIDLVLPNVLPGHPECFTKT